MVSSVEDRTWGGGRLVDGPRRRSGPLFGPLVVVLGALVSAGCGGVDSPPRHLFLITVDTLRADHLSLYGYPRETSTYLEELAANGVVFERAISQWPATGSSFASIFTGRYPRTTGLTQGAAVHLSGDHLTMAELLSAKGFTTAAVVSNGVLRRSMGWAQGFDEFLQTWDLAPEEPSDPVAYRQWLNAQRVNELALPLLDRLRHEERLFLWLHYSDPHAPYYLPAGVANPFLGDPWDDRQQRVELTGDLRARTLADNRQLGYHVAHYDANIRLADDHIRQALDRAGELGLLDDALIIFTSDHGESLGEHEYFFGHGLLPYNDGLHVPLLMLRTRGGEGRRFAPPVELIDLYPTVRSLLANDLEAPGLEGDDLAPLLAGEGASNHRRPVDDHLAFSQAGGQAAEIQFRTVQDGHWKLVHQPSADEHRPELWELYRLDRDPGEEHDLQELEPRELERLRTALEHWMAEGGEPVEEPVETEAQREEVSKALRALGYLD